MKVLVDKEQASWISRNFNKIALAQSDADKKRKIKRISDKFLNHSKGVELNKPEARAVLQAVEVGVMALTKALEKYETDEAKYKEYIEKATDKKKMLDGLLTKIKRKLK